MAKREHTIGAGGSYKKFDVPHQRCLPGSHRRRRLRREWRRWRHLHRAPKKYRSPRRQRDGRGTEMQPEVGRSRRRGLPAQRWTAGNMAAAGLSEVATSTDASRNTKSPGTDVRLGEADSNATRKSGTTTVGRGSERTASDTHLEGKQPTGLAHGGHGAREKLRGSRRHHESAWGQSARFGLEASWPTWWTVRRVFRWTGCG